VSFHSRYRQVATVETAQVGISGQSTSYVRLRRKHPQYERDDGGKKEEFGDYKRSSAK
jgi:hypothetical protein